MEHRRSEATRLREQHHRSGEPDVERTEGRDHPERLGAGEAVDRERERVVDHRRRAEAVDAEEVAAPLVPQHDAHRTDVDGRELQPVLLAELPDVVEPLLHGYVDRIRRVREHVAAGSHRRRALPRRAPRQPNRGAPVAASRACQWTTAAPDVGAAQRVGRALRRRVRNVRVLCPHRRLVEADLDDRGVPVHQRGRQASFLLTSSPAASCFSKSSSHSWNCVASVAVGLGAGDRRDLEVGDERRMVGRGLSRHDLLDHRARAELPCRAGASPRARRTRGGPPSRTARGSPSRARGGSCPPRSRG